MSDIRTLRGRAPSGRPIFTLLCASMALAMAGTPALRAQTASAPAAPAPAAAPADAAIELPSFSVTTTQDKGYLAANSVSATRINTPISDLPFSVSAFTQQFIEDTSPADLYDIVKYAAGVTSGAKEFNAGEDSFTIRGFQQSPERNGFNEGGGGNVYVDPVNIERVEVVKGPSALLYGQVAPGGTVNYITKTPKDGYFVTVNAGIGNDQYYRGTIDLNVPIIPGTLLFRFNGAYENGFEYENIKNTAKTTVFSPSLTWNVFKNLTLKVNYQSFYRYENPAAVYPPNMDVATPASVVAALKGPAFGPSPSAALTSLVGVDANANYKDAADLGFAGPYPGLPNNFDYDNTTDWRKSDLEDVNVELDATLGEHWLARADFDLNKNNVAFNQTGVGDVFLAPPGSLIYTPGAAGAVGTWAVSTTWNAQATAAKTAEEYAFGQQLLANPQLAFQTQVNNAGAATANPAIIARRPRVQYVYGGFKTGQAELAGDYDFSWGKIKPLAGFYWDSNYVYNVIRLNTGTAASPFYQTWDVDPASPTYFINQSPTPIDPSQFTSLTPDTLSYASDQAFYGLISASFLNDRLYLIGGARYNQSQSITTNFLGTTPASIYPQGFRAHFTTPQVGVGFKVTKDSMLYASYSTSYTFGGGFLQSPQLVNNVETAVITGQQAPVTSEGEEVGFKTQFLNDRISSTLSVYRIVQSNGIQSFNTIYPNGTLATTFQGVVVKSQGVEYEVTWTPIDNLQIFASAAEDDIRYTSEPLGDLLYLGVHPPFTAKTLGNVWGRYTFVDGILKGLWIGAGANYVGPTNGNAVNPYLFYPSYTLFNSAVGYDWKYGKAKLTLAANWDNMTNKFYQPADQEVGLPSRYTVSLAVHF